MKRTWIIAAALLVLSGAIYVSSHLMAQPTGTAPARAAAPQTRIALCNLSAVIKGYKRYQAFQAESGSPGRYSPTQSCALPGRPPKAPSSW